MTAWDAVVALDPAVSEADEGSRFPLCKPERLTELFTQAGLLEVQARAIDVQTKFARAWAVRGRRGDS